MPSSTPTSVNVPFRLLLNSQLGTVSFATGNAGPPRHLAEGAIPVVMEQVAAAAAGQIQVWVAVVVVIPDRDSHAIGVNRQTGPRGDILEVAVRPLVVERGVERTFAFTTGQA